MDNGAHFDGDQSGTVNGVTPPAVQHLTAEVTADSGEYQVLARWDTPKVVKGELYASPDRNSGRRQ